MLFKFFQLFHLPLCKTSRWQTCSVWQVNSQEVMHLSFLFMFFQAFSPFEENVLNFGHDVIRLFSPLFSYTSIGKRIESLVDPPLIPPKNLNKHVLKKKQTLRTAKVSASYNVASLIPA